MSIRYNTPEKGTLDWDVPLNENFRQLDVDVEHRDVEANATQYDPAVGAKFLATDTENVFVGDGEQWLRLPASGKNPTFETVDAGRFADAYSVQFRDPRVLVSESGWNSDKPLRQHASYVLEPRTQLLNEVDVRVGYTFYQMQYDEVVYRTDPTGGVVRVGRVPSELGSLTTICGNVYDEWLVIAGENAYVFASPEDMEANDPAAGPVASLRPLSNNVVPYWDEDGGDRGFVWAEYTVGDSPTVSIVRASSAGGYSIDAVLTLSRNDYRHFHSLDHDPYEPGTMYATTGDGDPQPQFFRSTDYGKTWAKVPGAGGTQLFRTLRLNFDENYVYWAMDGHVDEDHENGACYLLRATRDELDDPEWLAKTPQGLLSYGSVRVFNPNGILFTTRDEHENNYSRIPLYFYDIESERLRVVHEFPVDYDLHWRPGVHATLPYQNETTGDISLYLYGVPSPQSERGLSDTAQRWVDLSIQKLM